MSEETKENETEVEVMEFSLMDEEIDELIAKLKLLKDTKEHVHFDVDDDNEFIIRHDDENEEEADEEGKEGKEDKENEQD